MEDLTKDIIPVASHELCWAEYSYVTKVDFAQSVSKSTSLCQKICILLTALLNAVGGILILSGNSRSRRCDIDQWQRDLGQQLSKFIPNRDTLIKLIPVGQSIYVYIRKSSHLITLDSHLFIRDGPQNIKKFNASDLSRIITQTVTVPPPVHHAPEWSYDQVLQEHESNNLEYKFKDTTKILKKKKNTNTVLELYENHITDHADRAIFSFPNNLGGGRLVLGVDESDKARGNVVKGHVISLEVQQQLEVFMDEFLKKNPKTMEQRIWGDEMTIPQMGKHWDIHWIDVSLPGSEERRVAIVIDLYQCQGGLFMQCPESYVLDQHGSISRLSYSEWRDLILDACVDAISNMGSVSFSGESGKERTTPDSTRHPTHSKEELDRQLRRKSMLSWIEHNRNWRDRVDVRQRALDNDVLELVIESHMFEATNPVHFTPDEADISAVFPDIEPALEAIKKAHAGNGFVIATRYMFKCFSHGIQLRVSDEHVVDFLLVENNRLHLWTVVRRQGNKEELERQRGYLFLSGRIIKRYLVEVLSEWHRSTTFPVWCHTYSLSDNLEVQYDHTPPSLYTVLDAAEVPCMELIKAIAHMFLSKETKLKSILGDPLSIRLTCKQYKAIVGTEFSRVTFIVGPPGTGKSIIGFHLCQQFKKDTTLYVVSSAEFKAYVDYLDICKTSLVTQEKHLQALLDETQLHSIRRIIVDDVQTMHFRPEAWENLFKYINCNSHIQLLLLGDPDVQTFLPGAPTKALMKQVASFPWGENPMTYPLGHIHRNSPKIVAYLHGCMRQNDPLICTSPVEGDDVETRLMTDVRVDSEDNQLVEYIHSITRPEDRLDNSTSTTVCQYRDIMLMIAGSNSRDDVNHFRELLEKYLGKDKVQPPQTYPVTGIRIGAVGDFHGLEALVCICITDRTALEIAKTLDNSVRRSVEGLYMYDKDGKGTPDDSIHSLLHNNYRAFVCSRAIQKMVFITEAINTDLVSGLGYDDLTRLHEETSTQQAPSQDSNDFTAQSRNAAPLPHGDKAIATALLDLIEQKKPLEDKQRIIEVIMTQASAAYKTRNWIKMSEVGGHYMAVVLKLLDDDLGQLPSHTLADVWWICYCLLWAKSNCDTYITNKAVRLMMAALGKHTDTKVTSHVLLATTLIAVYHPRELLLKSHIDRLIQLLHFVSQQVVSFWACVVLMQLLDCGPDTWPDEVDRGLVETNMRDTIRAWSLEGDVLLNESHFIWYKEHISCSCPALQHYVAWTLCHFVITDPGTYCPMVDKDIGLSYLDSWVLDDQCVEEAHELLQRVVDLCRMYQIQNGEAGMVENTEGGMTEGGMTEGGMTEITDKEVDGVTETRDIDMDSVTETIDRGGGVTETNIKKGGVTETRDIEKGGVTEIRDLEKGGVTETRDIEKGGVTETRDIEKGGVTETIGRDDGGVTETIDREKGGVTETRDIEKGGVTETIGRDDGGVTETIDREKGGVTETRDIEKGGVTETRDLEKGGVTETRDLEKGGVTEIRDLEKGGVTEIRDLEKGGVTEIRDLEKGGVTEIRDIEKGGVTETIGRDDGGVTETIDRDDGGVTETRDREKGGVTETNIEKGGVTETRDKEGGGVTEPMDIEKGSVTEIFDREECEGPNMAEAECVMAEKRGRYDEQI